MAPRGGNGGIRRFRHERDAPERRGTGSRFPEARPRGDRAHCSSLPVGGRYAASHGLSCRYAPEGIRVVPGDNQQRRPRRKGQGCRRRTEIRRAVQSRPPSENDREIRPRYGFSPTASPPAGIGSFIRISFPLRLTGARPGIFWAGPPPGKNSRIPFSPRSIKNGSGNLPAVSSFFSRPGVRGRELPAGKNFSVSAREEASREAIG